MSYKSSISSQNIEDILKKIDGAIVLDPAILSLSSSSSSTTISNAVGGSSGFTDILNSLRGGGITFGIIKDDSAGKGFIQANMYAHPTENKLTIAWLDSLTPKEVVITRSGSTFDAVLSTITQEEEDKSLSRLLKIHMTESWYKITFYLLPFPEGESDFSSYSPTITRMIADAEILMQNGDPSNNYFASDILLHDGIHVRDTPFFYIGDGCYYLKAVCSDNKEREIVWDFKNMKAIISTLSDKIN